MDVLVDIVREQTLGIGALVGVGLIVLDTTLGAMKKLRIPPLAREINDAFARVARKSHGRFSALATTSCTGFRR